MEEILKLIDDYWKFDEAQQPMSSWHDKQDLLKAVSEVKLFATPDVVGQSEQFICPHCGKYKRMQGNGIMHQLCECGE